MTPGWVHPCTCGKTERGAYCHDCRGFGDGFNGGTWERTPVTPTVFNQAKQGGPETSAPESRARSVGRAPSAEGAWCPGGHRGATVRENAAYCAECKGRIRPAASSNSSLGTGH